MTSGPGAPDWLDELPLEPGPPWLTMGTHGLGAAPLLLRDDEHDRYIAEKRALLADAHDDVVISLPSAEDASREAAELVAAESGGALDPARPPLEAAALLAQEDLAVMVRRDGFWHLDAGVICFPSHWDPRDKLGLPVTAVHGQVPHYEDELATKVDRFLDKLRPERPAWRRIWMLHPSPALHVPRSPSPDAIAQTRVPEDMWLRTERQCLVSLPRTGAVLFTIRTQQVPLATLTARPDVAAKLAATATAWSPALAAYRSNAALLPRLLEWLDELA